MVCALVPVWTERVRHVESLRGWVHWRPAHGRRGALMTTNQALDAIVALRSIWERKLGRVTLADLGLVLARVTGGEGGADKAFRGFE